MRQRKLHKQTRELWCQDLISEFWKKQAFGCFVIAVWLTLIAVLIFSVDWPRYVTVTLLVLTLIPGSYLPILTYNRLLRSLRKKFDAATWFALDFEKLKSGDVIATRNDGKFSQLIRKETGSAFSHVSIYVGNGLICEAVPPSARYISAANILTTNKNNFRVLRARGSGLDTNKVASEAGFYAKNLYSPAKALSMKLPLAAFFSAKDANICSELVAEVYCYRRW